MDLKLKKIDLQRSIAKKSDRSKLFWVCLALGILVILAYFISSLNNSSSLSVFKFSIPIPIPGNPLKSTDNRVNILMLGNAGGVHDGPDLTDSIIVASYNLKTNNVTLISIPRDLWISDTKTKINALYEIGKRSGDGLNFAKIKIGNTLGIPIHYGIRLDFSGFAKAIDTIDGIAVDVPITFDDYNFPIEGKEKDLCDYKEEERELKEEEIRVLSLPSPYPTGLWYSALPTPLLPGKYKVLIDPEGKVATDSSKIKFDCRFEHLHFAKGKVILDGDTALKFVRSRMGTNGEGSDFARSRRQQLVLSAFRKKALSLKTLFNPAKTASLIITFGDSIETDIPKERVVDFYKLVKNTHETKSIVLGDLGKGKSLLMTPPAKDYGGAFVLVPLDNNFTLIFNFIKQNLEI